MYVGKVYAHEHGYFLRPEEGITAPGAEVISSCEPPNIAVVNGTCFSARVGSSSLLSFSPAQRLCF